MMATLGESTGDVMRGETSWFRCRVRKEMSTKNEREGDFAFFDPADCLHLLHPGATHMLDLTLRPVSPCLYPSRMYTFREIAVDIWSVMGIR